MIKYRGMGLVHKYMESYNVEYPWTVKVVV